MKKVATIVAALVLVIVAALVAVRFLPIGSASILVQNSERAASSLQAKINAIKKADADKKRRVSEKVDVSELELESYVMVSLKKQIPIRVESIHVRLTPGEVAADTRLTIPSGSTGNVFVDTLVTGTHDIYVKGKLTGVNAQGKFDLREVRVDGIPVPNILIDSLIKKYVKPQYPDVDLKEPFDLPWGIDAIDIGMGKATITY